VLYIFPGLQNIDWIPVVDPDPTGAFDIIQPVLQYGKTPAGGGAFWGLASWYVTSGGVAVYSTVIPVSAGGWIWGNMTQAGPSTWFIGGDYNGQSANITVNKPTTLKSVPNAYCTLEVYGITQCSYLPPVGSSCAFTQMTLTDTQGPVSQNWQSVAGSAACSLGLKISGTSALAITF